MPLCSNCGVQIQPDFRFCQSCGHPLQAKERELSYRISITRIVFLCIVSASLYLFYWSYVTWKQYRDHAHKPVYPVWHALTLLVPIYGLFRMHEHARAFRELMARGNVRSTISPGWVVIALLVTGILEGASFGLGLGDITENVALGLLVLAIVSVSITAGLLTQLQDNLNKYWGSLEDVKIQVASIGIGEVILALLGVLVWIDAFATLLSPAYRDWLQR